MRMFPAYWENRLKGEHYSAESFAVVGIAASVLYAITGALGILSSAFNIVAAKENLLA